MFMFHILVYVFIGSIQNTHCAHKTYQIRSDGLNEAIELLLSVNNNNNGNNNDNHM